jgi:hypothetical protein
MPLKKRPSLDTPVGAKHRESSSAPGDKPTPAPDSLDAAVEQFAESVARSTSSSPPSSGTGELKGLFGAMNAALRDGEHERAIRAADLALRKQPGLAVAMMCKKESLRLLEAGYLKRIGPLSHVPSVRADAADRAALDAPSKFVLSLVNGSAAFAAVISASCMERLVALRVLDGLIARGLIDRSGGAPGWSPP